jgi:hypothetical protein
MNAIATQAKVLKIGIVVDDKLVEERVVAGQQPVTMGRSSKATFQVAEAGTETEDFLLFIWRDGKYYLRFVPSMKGQFTLQGEKHSVAKLSKAESTPKEGDAFVVVLDEEDKGFVNVGPAKVLFRFVEAPVQALPPPVETPMDFRPRLLQDDDPVFLGMLGMMSALALVFGLWVANSEPRKLTLADMGEDLRARQKQIAKIIEQAPKAEKAEKAKEKEKEEEKKADKADPKPEEVAKAKPSEPRKADPKAMEDARKRVEQTSALIQAVQMRILAGRGDASRGTVSLLNQGADDVSGLSGLVQKVQGTGVTDNGSGLRSGGAPGGTGQIGIGEIRGGADGGAGLTVAPAPKIVKPNMSDGGATFDGGDVTDVKNVVKSQKGTLLACHENALKTNPKVAGKVVVEWVVAAGAATDIHVVDNTTDDAGLESCVVTKIKRWKFTNIPDGNVRQTFVFQPKEE